MSCENRGDAKERRDRGDRGRSSEPDLCLSSAVFEPVVSADYSYELGDRNRLQHDAAVPAEASNRWGADYMRRSSHRVHWLSYLKAGVCTFVEPTDRGGFMTSVCKYHSHHS